ncbi:hypothetical protein F5Y14DRAFT_458978 [Nemania sp. NC0429]|nr:hypothetical protein F5Y14DRAFT_458978 [Nemania sp. NC0429]
MSLNSPLDPTASVVADCGDRESTPLRVIQASQETTTNCRKRGAQCDENSVEKRSKTMTDGRLPLLVPTQMQASFRSYRVTKPITKIQGSATTIEKLTPQSTCLSQVSSGTQDFEDGRICNYSRGQLPMDANLSKPPRPVGISLTQDATLDKITQRESASTSSPVVESSTRISLCCDEPASSQIVQAVYSAAADDEGSDPSDAYPLDGGIEDDDIAQLLPDHSGFVQETHIPPSSVQGWDHESRSAAEYDPSLKCSPPDLHETGTDAAGTGRLPVTRQPDAEEDLLDEDVDWNAVLANANAIKKAPSVYSYVERKITSPVKVEMRRTMPRVAGTVDEVVSLPALIRKPFPQKIRDRPSVAGMSSDTLLRTCFRIGAMISQTVHCFKHQQDVVFEVYARVTYSSRETLVRKQHFQFIDLCKDQQPYPAATLANWRVGSQLDIDSSAFLDTSAGPRLCRCMCKPMKDPKAAIGWTYSVLKIEEIDWEEINRVKKIF